MHDLKIDGSDSVLYIGDRSVLGVIIRTVPIGRVSEVCAFSLILNSNTEIFSVHSTSTDRFFPAATDNEVEMSGVS